jgi:hypothetical protein
MRKTRLKLADIKWRRFHQIFTEIYLESCGELQNAHHSALTVRL